MKPSIKILMLEDSDTDAHIIQRYLQKAEFVLEPKVVSTKKDYTEALQSFSPDVILSDHSMPQFNSLDALTILKNTGKKTPFILVTGTVSEDFAVQCILAGAQDYILKDRLTRLPGAILNALEKQKLENERQKYVNEIVAKEALVSKVEKLAHIGSWENNLITGKVTWSDETFRILGYTPGEITPSREMFIKSIHPLDQLGTKRAVEAAEVKNANSLKISYRIINRDKSIKHLSTEMFFERDDKNEPVLITGFMQDITAAKLAEEELNKTNQELSRVLENVDECLYSLDTTTYKFLQVSAAAEKVYGYTSDEFFTNSRLWYDIIIPEDKHIVDTADEKIYKGESVSLQFRITHKNGSIRWLESNVIPIVGDAGKIIRIDGVVRDITEKKESEEKLHRSQVHLLSSQTIGHVGSWEILNISVNDPLHGSPLYWSDETFRIFGLEPGEIDMTTNSFLQMVHHDDRDNVYRAFNEAFNNKKNYDIDHRIIYKDNTERFVHERGEIIYDPQTGKRLKMIGTVQDITERKIAELEREKITTDLVQRNKNLEQFAYIVSHNLRAPVANIIGFSNAISDLNLGGKKENELFNALSDSVSSLDDVLMDLNRILQVKQDISEKRETVKLQKIVKEAKTQLAQLINTERVIIKTDFTAVDEMPSLRSYIYSIFYNLILNSIKFSRPGIAAVIEIKSAIDANKIILTFKDNGLGIDLTKRGDQVFGLYKRFHSQIEGKGIGLFMVKTQVETLGGKISVTSEVDKGTEFRIEFTA